MIPDKGFIERSFAKFNEMCFAGELPPIEVKLTKARTFLGKVTYKGVRGIFGRVTRYEDFCMRISTLFDLPENEWEDVVIHEMIHYFIARNCIRDTSTHGRVFRQMMAAINEKFGRNVGVRHHSAQGQAMAGPVEKPRTNYLCISQLQDGGYGITVCAEEKVNYLRRALPRYFKIKSMTWYVSRDPFFNKYPRSRTPKIYKISPEDIEVHLKEIQRDS